VYAQMPARRGAAIRELHAEGVAYAQMPDRLSLHYQTGGSHALRCADHAQRTRRRPDPCNKRERATNTIRGGFPLYTQVHRCVSFQYDDVIDLSLYGADRWNACGRRRDAARPHNLGCWMIVF
jgi:hypothetical protein